MPILVILSKTPFIASLLILSILISIIGWSHPEIISVYGMHPYFIDQQDYLRLAIQASLFQFFHGGILHLLSNALFLVVVGTGIELAIGSKRMFSLFVCSTFASMAFLYAFSSGITIGISTFCMAVLGYYAMSVKDIHSQEFKSAMTLLVINILMGLYGNISLTGHLGGAIGGIVYFTLERMFLKKATN